MSLGIKGRKLLLIFLYWCPGALGLFLRQKLYPRFLINKCGRKVLIGRFVTLKGPSNITIGDNVVINDYVTINSEQYHNNGVGITIGKNTFIGAGSELICSGNKIVIKNNVNLGSNCLLMSDRKTVIENDVLMAAYCSVGSRVKNEEKENALKTNKKNHQEKKYITSIGPGCWLGVRTKITSGSQIGEGSVVGAHAVVEGNLPPMVVAVGDPAQVLYHRQ